MKQRVKKLWVDALRSGDYEQNIGFLREGDRFDPLGILCDLYRVETGNGSWEKEGCGVVYAFVLDGSRCPSVLLEAVRVWAGLGSLCPKVCVDSLSDSWGLLPISALNDRGMTFSEMADLLEVGLSDEDESDLETLAALGKQSVGEYVYQAELPESLSDKHLEEYMPQVLSEWFRNTDNGFVILMAVRYALSRHSMAPSAMQSWLREHWKLLPEGEQEMIVRDINQEVRRWRKQRERGQLSALEKPEFYSWSKFLEDLEEMKSWK